MKILSCVVLSAALVLGSAPSFEARQVRRKAPRQRGGAKSARAPRAAVVPSQQSSDSGAPTLSIGGEPFKGNGRARVVMIEFSDFECSYCGRYFAGAYSQIDAAYVKTGKIKYVFRDFPLERLHANAFQAAEAANCADEQGKFWAMHDRLFANQLALGRGELPEHAAAIGLNQKRFDLCFASGKFANAIRRDLEDGASAGVGGTPTFLIGVAMPGGANVRVVKTLSGSLPFEEFKAALDAVLNAAK